MSEVLNFFIQSDRLKTVKNWSEKYISAKVFTAAGFYYNPNNIKRLDPSPQVESMIKILQTFRLILPVDKTHETTDVIDSVKCFSCNVQLAGGFLLHAEDDVLLHHKRFSPRCRFIRFLERMCNK